MRNLNPTKNQEHDATLMTPHGEVRLYFGDARLPCHGPAATARTQARAFAQACIHYASDTPPAVGETKKEQQQFQNLLKNALTSKRQQAAYNNDPEHFAEHFPDILCQSIEVNLRNYVAGSTILPSFDFLVDRNDTEGYRLKPEVVAAINAFAQACLQHIPRPPVAEHSHAR